MDISPSLSYDRIAIEYSRYGIFGTGYVVAVTFNEPFDDDDLKLSRLLNMALDNDGTMPDDAENELNNLLKLGKVVIASDNNPVTAMSKAMLLYNEKWANYKP